MQTLLMLFYNYINVYIHIYMSFIRLKFTLYAISLKVFFTNKNPE